MGPKNNFISFYFISRVLFSNILILSFSAIVQSNTTTKAIVQSNTTTKAIVQSNTTTKAIVQSNTTTKAIVQSNTTTKAIVQSNTTTKVHIDRYVCDSIMNVLLQVSQGFRTIVVNNGF
ncbi:hypothetical protein GQR58_026207 [Nymphon striatum]|nr:hypothetical protein GQR58_026207 [Nymphon striatum]